MSALNYRLDRLGDAIEGLHSKIGSMRPEDVVTAAAANKPRLHGELTKESLRGSSSLKQGFNKTLVGAG